MNKTIMLILTMECTITLQMTRVIRVKVKEALPHRTHSKRASKKQSLVAMMKKLKNK